VMHDIRLQNSFNVYSRGTTNFNCDWILHNVANRILDKIKLVLVYYTTSVDLKNYSGLILTDVFSGWCSRMVFGFVKSLASS